jgi:Type I phosphodiesterase / nucleotide pyrophosphatase
MSLDDLALTLQHLVDRAIRWMRLGRAPATGPRRLLLVQIDGLSRSVLEEALADGRMPALRRLIERRGYGVAPMSVGLPSSTPAFQMAAMYGVVPDIPGFHYHDKKRRVDVYFPRAGDAAFVEAAQAGGRLGIVQDGSTYGCIFTGGAADHLFSFARIKRPSGAGMVRLLAAFVLVGWVCVKCVGLSAVELARALARLIADPMAEVERGWRWLVLKLALSVWVHEVFTLSVSRDVYRGVPAVYVNYLDYDVFAHSFGPRHRRAMRALRRIDRSLASLERAVRRVPEYRYDLYVLSDHGQVATVPFPSLTGGRTIERLLFDEVFDPSGASPVRVASPAGRRLLAAVRTFRTQRHHGLFQRFLGYLERDFLARLSDVREAHERGGVRVVAAGSNAFVYFVDEPEPLTIERIEGRYPGLAQDLSRTPGIGLVLARSESGPICAWRGKRYRLTEIGDGPFAGRSDLDVVVQGIGDLMAMPSAGDLVLYGNNAPEGDVSFLPEAGAHAGPGPEELHTFVVFPPSVTLPSSLVHPVQLYAHFIEYQRASRRAA